MKRTLSLCLTHNIFYYLNCAKRLKSQRESRIQFTSDISEIHATTRFCPCGYYQFHHISPILNEVCKRYIKINVHLGITETVFYSRESWQSSPSNFYVVCLGKVGSTCPVGFNLKFVRFISPFAMRFLRTNETFNIYLEQTTRRKFDSQTENPQCRAQKVGWQSFSSRVSLVHITTFVSESFERTGCNFPF